MTDKQCANCAGNVALQSHEHAPPCIACQGTGRAVEARHSPTCNVYDFDPDVQLGPDKPCSCRDAKPSSVEAVYCSCESPSETVRCTNCWLPHPEVGRALARMSATPPAAEPARLDADRTAKPKTEIVGVYDAGDGRTRTLHHNMAESYVVRPTTAAEPTGALMVWCSGCSAAPGVKCMNPMGDSVSFVHSERTAATHGYQAGFADAVRMLREEANECEQVARTSSVNAYSFIMQRAAGLRSSADWLETKAKVGR